MLQYPKKYQLMFCCAAWHDVTSQIQIKFWFYVIYESRAFKRYTRISKFVDILEEALKMM